MTAIFPQVELSNLEKKVLNALKNNEESLTKNEITKKINAILWPVDEAVAALWRFSLILRDINDESLITHNFKYRLNLDHPFIKEYLQSTSVVTLNDITYFEIKTHNSHGWNIELSLIINKNQHVNLFCATNEEVNSLNLNDVQTFTSFVNLNIFYISKNKINFDEDVKLHIGRILKEICNLHNLIREKND